MSTATIRARRPGLGRDDERGSRAWFWLIVVAVVALAGFLVAWLGGWIRFTTDPRVTEILTMQEDARAKYAARGGPSNLIEATAAVAAMNAIQQKIDALPAHLRPQVERAGGGMMRNVARSRIDAYFAAAPAQRQAELDRQIDQEEFMRKASEAASAVAGVLGGGQRGGGSGTGGAGGSGSAGPGNTGGGGGGGGGAPGGGGPPRGSTQDDRNRWRKNMIDRTSPEDRARYSEYRRAMEERREQRGLPSGFPR